VIAVPPLRPRFAAVLRRLAALAAAALLVVSALNGGRSYLWCSMMERAVEACCCEPAADDGDHPEGATLHAACCEDHVQASLDKGRVGGAVEVPGAAVSAAVPPSVMAAVIVLRPTFVPGGTPALACPSPIRAGPRRAAETAVRLQVFRC
jgi:hypothetical protein